MFLRKTRVIIDTNVLLLSGQRGVDVFLEIDNALREPYKLCTYSLVLNELEKLMENNGKNGFNAKLGFILAKQKDLKIIACSKDKHTDDVIVEHAQKNDVIVTQDRALIKRLLQKQIRVLRYQQGKFVFQHNAEGLSRNVLSS